MCWGAVWPQRAASCRPQRAAPASTSRWSQRPANAGAVTWWCIVAGTVVAPTWARGYFHAVGGVLAVLHNTEVENEN